MYKGDKLRKRLTEKSQLDISNTRAGCVGFQILPFPSLREEFKQQNLYDMCLSWLDCIQ